VDGDNGKIDRTNLQEALRGRRDLHASQPRVVSLTNTTELGTLYRPNQIAELADLAKSKGLAVHVDGARFANAVASAGCTPAELTWKAGVDVLVFGGTKNGLALGEAVVFFKNQVAADFMYRMKQSGQLASKMRLLAAQWLGLFEAENGWNMPGTRTLWRSDCLPSSVKSRRLDSCFHVKATPFSPKFPSPLSRAYTGEDGVFIPMLGPGAELA